MVYWYSRYYSFFLRRINSPNELCGAFYGCTFGFFSLSSLHQGIRECREESTPVSIITYLYECELARIGWWSLSSSMISVFYGTIPVSMVFEVHWHRTCCSSFSTHSLITYHKTAIQRICLCWSMRVPKFFFYIDENFLYPCTIDDYEYNLWVTLMTIVMIKFFRSMREPRDLFLLHFPST